METSLTSKSSSTLVRRMALSNCFSMDNKTWESFLLEHGNTRIARKVDLRIKIGTRNIVIRVISEHMIDHH